MSYDDADSVYYSNSTNDEDDEDFNSLNKGIALIAIAFSKFSTKSNDFALHQIQGIKLSFRMVMWKCRIVMLEGLGTEI